MQVGMVSSHAKFNVTKVQGQLSLCYAPSSLNQIKFGLGLLKDDGDHDIMVLSLSHWVLFQVRNDGRNC